MLKLGKLVFLSNYASFYKTRKVLPIISALTYSTSSSNEPFVEPVILKAAENVPPMAAPRMGQPTHFTHPHLLNREDVNKGVLRNEFMQRRDTFAEKIASSPMSLKSKHKPAVLAGHARYQSHLVVIPASKKSFMIDKIPYFFRQDTDFRYLTGGLEPDCVLIMEVAPNSHRSILFLREPNLREEKWEGPRTRANIQSADFFGVDLCMSNSSLEMYLNKYRAEHHEFLLWYDYLNPRSSTIHQIVMDFIRNLPSHQDIESPRQLIHEMRLKKSPAEISLCRQACSIGANSVSETIRMSKHFSNEQQVFSTVDHQCKMKGAQHLAYPPVVAAGDNANIIHYINSDQEIQNEDLILMDAGCEYHGYTSDITRTWPKSGRFSECQALIYQLVLELQEYLFDKLFNRDEVLTTVDSLYNASQRYLGEKLLKEGLCSSDLSESQLMAKSSEFCPHHVSHYLGMDVHDTALISRNLPLRAGMIITVEPGIYIPKSKLDVPEEFRGIGVRIEDDILITETGFEVLTKDCPRHVEDIERLCSS